MSLIVEAAPVGTKRHHWLTLLPKTLPETPVRYFRQGLLHECLEGQQNLSVLENQQKMGSFPYTVKLVLSNRIMPTEER